MATLDDIYNLLQKVWKYLPVSGAPGSPWVEEEKIKAIKKLVSLEKRIDEFRSRQTSFSSEMEGRLAKFEESIIACSGSLKDIENNVLKDHLPLIVKLLSNQIESEDLERIMQEEEYGQ